MCVCVIERMNQVIYIFFARTSSEIMFFAGVFNRKIDEIDVVSCLMSNELLPVTAATEAASESESGLWQAEAVSAMHLEECSLQIFSCNSNSSSNNNNGYTMTITNHMKNVRLLYTTDCESTNTHSNIIHHWLWMCLILLL